VIEIEFTVAKRGEGTKAILVFGEAKERLVPFEFENSTYLIPARLLRHHPKHPDCPVVEEALKAPNSWKDIVTKGAELRAQTVRCTGGCWTAYEASEQLRITRGDHNALEDWQRDGVRARAELARRVREGDVPSAHVTR